MSLVCIALSVSMHSKFSYRLTRYCWCRLQQASTSWLRAGLSCEAACRGEQQHSGDVHLSPCVLPQASTSNFQRSSYRRTRPQAKRRELSYTTLKYPAQQFSFPLPFSWFCCSYQNVMVFCKQAVSVYQDGHKRRSCSAPVLQQLRSSL